MRLGRHPTTRLIAFCLLPPFGLTYTWPDPRIDELESMIYTIGGVPVDFILSCDQPPQVDGNVSVKGRLNQPEWLRTAFHDMATADVAAGTGGLDASIAFELDRAENKGQAIPDALRFFRQFQSPQVSLSDII